MTAWWLPLQGPQRKVIHAVLYEALAIGLITSLVPLVTGQAAQQGLALGLMTSAQALIWNVVFNTLFEAWERRQASPARTVRRRMAHAIGFEGGLVIMTVPVIAWLLHMTWWEALVADLGLVLLFLVYTFCLNWLFDHVFGLPQRKTSHLR